MRKQAKHPSLSPSEHQVCLQDFSPHTLTSTLSSKTCLKLPQRRSDFTPVSSPPPSLDSAPNPQRISLLLGLETFCMSVVLSPGGTFETNLDVDQLNLSVGEWAQLIFQRPPGAPKVSHHWDQKWYHNLCLLALPDCCCWYFKRGIGFRKHFSPVHGSCTSNPGFKTIPKVSFKTQFYGHNKKLISFLLLFILALRVLTHLKTMKQQIQNRKSYSCILKHIILFDNFI